MPHPTYKVIHITLPARDGKWSRTVTPVAAYPDEHVLHSMQHMQYISTICRVQDLTRCWHTSSGHV